jgi:hypothetical protein
LSKRVFLFALVLAACSSGALAAQFYYCGVGVPTNVVWDGSQPVLSYHNLNSAGPLGTFIWNPATGSHQISTSGTVGGIAAKGSSFVVTGNGINGATSAKRWDGDANGVGTWTALPLGAGSYSVSAYHVVATANNVYIAGSYNNSGASYACRYQESTNTTTLMPTPSGYHANAIGYSVSNSGTIVGSAMYGGSGGPTSGASNAVAGWNGSTMCGLDVLNGNPPNTTLKSLATGIALDDSRVCGWAEASAGVRKPVYWNGPITTSGVNPVQIPLLTGHDFGTSTAISADGAIVGGYSYTMSNNPASRTCWVWDAVNGTRDLKTLLTSYGVDSTGWQDVEWLWLSQRKHQRLRGLGSHHSGAFEHREPVGLGDGPHSLRAPP